MSRSLQIGNSSRTGFTLIELLVVIAVFSMLMGIGTVYMLKFTTGMNITSEMSRIRSALQRTRYAAVRSGRPAVLRFVQEGERIVGRRIGISEGARFSMDSPEGAYGVSFDPQGASFEPGLLGLCLHVPAQTEINLGSPHMGEIYDGFSISFYLKVTSGTGHVTLIRKEDMFRFFAAPRELGYQINAEFTIESGTGTFSSFDYLCDFDEWVLVELTCLFSGEVSIRCNGETAAAGTLTTPLSADGINNDLLLFDSSADVDCFLDELSVDLWRVVSEDTLLADTGISPLPAHVIFRSDGRRHENSAESITLLYDSASMGIAIDYMGNIYDK